MLAVLQFLGRFLVAGEFYPSPGVSDVFGQHSDHIYGTRVLSASLLGGVYTSYTG